MRRASFSFFLLFAVMLTAIAGSTAAQAEVSRELPVAVDPGLLASGVTATVAAVPPPSAQNADAPIAIVFVTFEKSFTGKLYVRGVRKDGKEIARSEFVRVSESAESGGHQRFPFDKHTRLDDVNQFFLEGDKTAPQPPAKEEDFGEAAKNIVKELLE